MLCNGNNVVLGRGWLFLPLLDALSLSYLCVEHSHNFMAGSQGLPEGCLLSTGVAVEGPVRDVRHS